jgi:hypothetical protein
MATDPDPPPIFGPARYAKGKIAVRCPPNGTGWKTRAARIASAVSSRYSHREQAYIMSPSAAAKVRKLYETERDADLGSKNGKFGFVA